MSALPTVIATIPKNSTEELRVSLDAFNGHDLISLRVWFKAADGEKRPGKQGLALRVEQLPELLDALHHAEEKAVSRGLLPRRRAAA